MLRKCHLPREGAEGQKDLNQSFNGLVNHLSVSIEGAGAEDEDGEREALVVAYADDFTFSVPEELIDNETKHAVTVSYEYGQISSEKDEDGAFVNVTVEGGVWKNIIFSCLAEINTYAWVKAPALTYAQTDGKTALSNIKATNTRDGKYTVTLDKLTTAAYDNMIDLTDAEAHLYSQSAKDGEIVEGSEDEYFSVALANVGTDAAPAQGLVFTPNSEAQNPEATVYSTLVIKAKDYFGHDVVIKIANVEVKKR